MPIGWWKLVVGALASAGTLQALWHHHRDRVNLTLMKFFRDLSRYKALRRRLRPHEQSKGLLAFLADDTHDPLADLELLDAERDDEDHLPTFSRQELWTMGNHDSEDGGLLLAILGRVYDVTEGDRFYGPSGTYGHFAGHDVTYALATGCKRMECVQTDWTKLDKDKESDKPVKGSNAALAAAFSDEEILEAKKWLSFFHLHDKYPLVGKLEGESFEDLVQKLLENDDGENEMTNPTNLSEEAMMNSL